MATNMATNLREMLPSQQGLSQKDDLFYKVQIKGWVDFDPAGRGLRDIVQAIEVGSGVVTAVEVSQVANGIGEINDREVRERFADIAAVNRLVENVGGLPVSLREKLQRALKGEPQVGQIQSQAG
jgi:hypothetical protein